mmetsp:Transcript_10758/g.19133  ORF Transcript_10758/g.19133 Transcript_10758/m.19133 type:complete len:265 (-) Transcript_10758:68-862(-)
MSMLFPASKQQASPQGLRQPPQGLRQPVSPQVPRQPASGDYQPRAVTMPVRVASPPPMQAYTGRASLGPAGFKTSGSFVFSPRDQPLSARQPVTALLPRMVGGVPMRSVPVARHTSAQMLRSSVSAVQIKPVKAGLEPTMSGQLMPRFVSEPAPVALPKPEATREEDESVISTASEDVEKVLTKIEDTACAAEPPEKGSKSPRKRRLSLMAALIFAALATMATAVYRSDARDLSQRLVERLQQSKPAEERHAPRKHKDHARMKR